MQNKAMQNVTRIFVAMVCVMALLLAATSITSAQGRGQKGGADKWADRFSAKGVVVSTDSAAGSMVVAVDVGSRLLKDSFGSNVTFQVSNDVKVAPFGMGGHGMGKGAAALGMKGGKRPGGGGKGGGGKGGHGRLTFADVQAGDAVFIAGTYDSGSKQYTVTKIMDWIH